MMYSTRPGQTKRNNTKQGDETKTKLYKANSFFAICHLPSEKHREGPRADPQAPEFLPGEVQAPGREQQPRQHPRQMPHEAAAPQGRRRATETPHVRSLHIRSAWSKPRPTPISCKV